MKIILASQSPRRKDLLSRMGVKFEVIPSNFDEELDNSRAAEEVAMELAHSKAVAVAKDYPDAIVIGSDSIVFLGNEQFGKPENNDEAREMLKKLSGTTHGVVSGVAVVRLRDGIKLVDSETAKIHFKPLNIDEIEKYVRSGDSLDKAGGYGVQSGAAPLIDYAEGDVSAIIGLPTKLLSEMLKKLGIESKSVKYDLPVKVLKV
ncbi:MAG TPA: Maf family protein [Candidatus Saccharimonadales bacterium]|nr:Maf family protein [Candidatus Saccharimonadales bacterium]